MLQQPFRPIKFVVSGNATSLKKMADYANADQKGTHLSVLSIISNIQCRRDE
jgi:hypothetical protein